MNGFLYIGCNGTEYFKIGISDNPRRRVGEIRRMNPTFTILYTYETDNPQVEEIILHEKFSHKRKRGEWFKLDPADLYWIAKHFERPGIDHNEFPEIVYFEEVHKQG